MSKVNLKNILKNKSINKLLPFFEILLMIYWMSALLQTKAFYITYLVVGIAGFITLFKNKEKSDKVKEDKKNKIILILAALMYALMVVLANYELLFNIINTVFIFIGAFLSFYNIIKFICGKSENIKFKLAENKIKPFKILIVFTIIMFIFNSAILIFGYYPGILTPDSINQITQIQRGEYSNHHPFYHTMIIKIFIELGMKLFNNINVAVFLYSLFQIFTLSLAIAYMLVTLYQINISKKYIIICYTFMLLMPYNILYSFTMWKDILFAISVLVFIVSLYRIINNVGKSKILNYLCAFISSIGFMLLRSNGFFAFVATFIILTIVMRKSNIKLIAILLLAIVISSVLKGPVLKSLNVKNVDFVESLSIPVQQVARVVKDNKELSENQKSVLNQIVDLNKIPSIYKDYISDPIKLEVRNHGNQEYLVNNKIKYLKLWIKLGIKYPDEYLMGWIDQTKGYWNGGYKYWVCSTGIYKNTLGIERTQISSIIPGLFDNYLNGLKQGNILSLLVSIGFNFWIVFLLLIYNIINRKKEFVLILPIIFLVGTLLIATPVYSEFRYIYSMFLCMPFLIFISFYKTKT